MARYKYTAKDDAGKNIKGIVEANDKKEAIGILRKKTLVIVSLEEQAAKLAFSLSKDKNRQKRVKVDDMVIFSRQLSTVVEAGIPLVNALDIIGDQMEKPDLKARVLKIRDDVESGSSLSDAIAKDKNFFSSFFINMVKAGETSGSLDEILDRLAVYLEKSNNLQKKVKSAMVYPAVVSAMAIVITSVMILFVIPVFEDIYKGFGAQLPGPTQFLIDVSKILKSYFYLIAIFIGVIIVLFKKYLKSEKGKFAFDDFKLKMPIFGVILRKVAVSKFTRTFSTLVKSGVPILNALDIVGKTAGNVVIEKAMEKVKISVKEGENIAPTISKSNIFPPMVVRMINVGEKTGELEKMLTKISDFYEAQVDAAVSGLTSLIEPLIIAFLGIVIGGIVICMFLPILQISTIVGV